ncbi:hypothetical protein KP509_17G024100 [Ceratopteris richardii]|uniref:DUF4408 domain-containing protein n=1 Tax=Ceratopteris richardii TaxID=49495 RepID=A0A8T2SUE4_CERRI|nr:hypothetical protein KP509_17G024100 [Ceratopteris richardii]
MTHSKDDSGCEAYWRTSALELLIMAVSLGLASIAGFYVHPHLLPVFTWLRSAGQGWMTAPILFVFVNLVVGTLYFNSTMLPKACCEEMQAREVAYDKSPTPPVSTTTSGGAVCRDNETIRSETETNENAETASVVPVSKPLSGLRARIERSKSFSRLIRSKSEQLFPTLTSRKHEDGSRYKKASSFEGALGARPRKPVVVVDDTPEDDSFSGTATGGSEMEEVDKKAEAFISRFYEKIKLQRIESLRRQQLEAAN